MTGYKHRFVVPNAIAGSNVVTGIDICGNFVDTTSANSSYSDVSSAAPFAFFAVVNNAAPGGHYIVDIEQGQVTGGNTTIYLWLTCDQPVTLYHATGSFTSTIIDNAEYEACQQCVYLDTVIINEIYGDVLLYGGGQSINISTNFNSFSTAIMLALNIPVAAVLTDYGDGTYRICVRNWSGYRDFNKVVSNSTEYFFSARICDSYCINVFSVEITEDQTNPSGANVFNVSVTVDGYPGEDITYQWFFDTGSGTISKEDAEDTNVTITGNYARVGCNISIEGFCSYQLFTQLFVQTQTANCSAMNCDNKDVSASSLFRKLLVKDTNGYPVLKVKFNSQQMTYSFIQCQSGLAGLWSIEDFIRLTAEADGIRVNDHNVNNSPIDCNSAFEINEYINLLMNDVQCTYIAVRQRGTDIGQYNSDCDVYDALPYVFNKNEVENSPVGKGYSVNIVEVTNVTSQPFIDCNNAFLSDRQILNLLLRKINNTTFAIATTFV